MLTMETHQRRASASAAAAAALEELRQRMELVKLKPLAETWGLSLSRLHGIKSGATQPTFVEVAILREALRMPQ